MRLTSINEPEIKDRSNINLNGRNQKILRYELSLLEPAKFSPWQNHRSYVLNNKCPSLDPFFIFFSYANGGSYFGIFWISFKGGRSRGGGLNLSTFLKKYFNRHLYIFRGVYTSRGSQALTIPIPAHYEIWPYFTMQIFFQKILLFLLFSKIKRGRIESIIFLTTVGDNKLGLGLVQAYMHCALADFNSYSYPPPHLPFPFPQIKYQG